MSGETLGPIIGSSRRSALNRPYTLYYINQAVAGQILGELIPRKGIRLSLGLKHAVQIAGLSYQP